MSEQFYFTITDLGICLGKSPVTIRAWERKGEVTIPRDKSGNRKLTIKDIVMLADAANHNKRLSNARLYQIKQAMIALEALQRKT